MNFEWTQIELSGIRLVLSSVPSPNHLSNTIRTCLSNRYLFGQPRANQRIDRLLLLLLLFIIHQMHSRSVSDLHLCTCIQFINPRMCCHKHLPIIKWSQAKTSSEWSLPRRHSFIHLLQLVVVLIIRVVLLMIIIILLLNKAFCPLTVKLFPPSLFLHLRRRAAAFWYSHCLVIAAPIGGWTD